MELINFGKYSTISVLNRKGKEVDSKQKCYGLKEYIENLGPEDVVVIESSTGAFCWADQVESKGALCYVLDPRKFRIIKDSWKKTDKHDSRNTVKALWVYIVDLPPKNGSTFKVREELLLYSKGRHTCRENDSLQRKSSTC